MSNKKTNGLEIEPTAYSNFFFFWTIQIFALVFLIIFLIAAMSGLFGSGFFSNQWITTADNSMKIQYDIFTRRNSVNTVSIQLVEAQKNPFIAISTDYLNKQYVKQIMPPPVLVETSVDKTIYHFMAQPGNAHIKFMFEPQQAGYYTARFTTNNQSLSFHQLVYP